jgi:serine/threonine protein kinase
MMEHADDLSDLDQLRSRYEVLRELGRDGGCVVYAVRGRGSDRHYAVKVISDPGFRSARPTALHVWHAHTVRQLDHPRMMVLHAVHHLQGGAVAIAMERRRGRTLAELIDEVGPLPADVVERVLRQIGEALAYLHSRDIAHRGVSPHSIFLDRDDNDDARLAHFGIDRSDYADFSAAGGAVLRAFAYLAPEQFDGKGTVDGRRVSARSDLYSLGLVGYSMLTGKRPWAAGSVEELIRMKRAEPLPALTTLRPDAPAHLCEVIERCLERKARRRWSSAHEFLASLDSAAASTGLPPTITRSGVRARVADSGKVLRKALGERLPHATRYRLALTVPVLVAGMVAVSLLRGSQPPATSGLIELLPPVTAAHEESPPAMQYLESDDLSVASVAPADASNDPIVTVAEVRVPDEPDPVSATPAALTPASTPEAPPSVPPPTGAHQFADGSSTSSGLVLLGDPINRRSATGVLGDPVRNGTRRQ